MSNPTEPERTIAVLGLGIIGSRVMQRLIAAGWIVQAWNRTPIAASGGFDTALAAATGANHISLYLKDRHAVRAVMDQISPSLAPGVLVMNHSTVDLDTTLHLQDLCESFGADFLDAPFTGSREAAAAGQLVYYLACPEALLPQAEAALQASAKATLFCGPVGAATTLKLATNLVSACTVQALSEAAAIAGKNGVSLEKFTKAIALNACASPLANMKLTTMAQGDYSPHFSLENMAKDSRYALELAARDSLEIPALAAVSNRLHELADAGLADLDYSALAKPYLSST